MFFVLYSAMVYIGIDYGRKRTGLAISISGIVMPLDPILNTTWKLIDSRIHELKEEQGEVTVIIGHPLTASGRETELSHEVNDLAGFLQERGHTVEVMRETGTTAEAVELRRNAKRDGRTDSIAAAIILKRYLGLV